MASRAEMGEMVSKETLALQAPWAPLEECQALLGVTGWWEPQAALESVEKRASRARGALQAFRLT